MKTVREHLAIILALIALAIPAIAGAQDSITVNTRGGNVTIKGDTLLVTDGGDTVHMVGTSVGALLKSILDDTIVTRDHNDTEVYYMNLAKRSKIDAFRDIVRWCVILIIVIAILLVIYFNRRAKYRMIEKAIDNNYQLPADVLGSNMPPMPSTPVYVQQPEQMQGSPVPPPVPPVVQQWPRYDGAVKLIAIGLGTMLFFYIIGAEPAVGLCSIILLLGVGKAFLVYQTRQDIMMQNRRNQGNQGEQ